jgi:hypothetical protein
MKLDNNRIEDVLARYQNAHARYCAIRGTLALSLIFIGFASSVGFPVALLLQWRNASVTGDSFRVVWSLIASAGFAFVVLVWRRASARRLLQRVKADLDEIDYVVVRDYEWPKQPMTLLPATAHQSRHSPSVPRGPINFAQYDRLFDPHLFA